MFGLNLFGVGILESRSADVTDNNTTPNIPGTMIEFNATVPTIARENNITVKWTPSPYAKAQEISVSDKKYGYTRQVKYIIGDLNNSAYLSCPNCWSWDVTSNNGYGIIDTNLTNTTGNYTIVGLESGVEYNITVSTINVYDGNISNSILATTLTNTALWTGLASDSWNMVSVPAGKHTTVSKLGVHRDLNITNIWSYQGGVWENGFSTNEFNGSTYLRKDKDIYWDTGLWIRTAPFVTDINYTITNVIAQDLPEWERSAEDNTTNALEQIKYMQNHILSNTWELMGVAFDTNGSDTNTSFSADILNGIHTLPANPNTTVTCSDVSTYYYQANSSTWDINTTGLTANTAVWLRKVCP